MNRLFALLLLLSLRMAGSAQSDWPIITREGDRLYEGREVFRFLGLAAPNIQQNESQIRTDRTNRFPDEYEIRDVLGGIQRAGGRATRTFSLSVFHPDDEGMPVYLPARRTYNEEAFRCLDRILALAPSYDVRLIIPFIASQSFGGIRGVDEFAALAGKPPGSFWTDDSVKADFRHFLTFLLNRVNTVSGIPYRDDPAILCWQLGNEFGSYAGDRGLDYAIWTPIIQAWTVEMAAFIKQTDPRHLVMEAGGVDRLAMIENPHIDLISDHLYEYWNRLGGRPWQLAPLAKESWAQCEGKKPLLIDEFGLGTTDNLRELLTAIRETGISGGLLWSIRGHRRDGGWYYHNEGGTPINSFHVPGFSNGYTYDETRLLDLLRTEAWKFRGAVPPAVEPPDGIPVIMPQGHGFTWRGCTGASAYTLQRSDKPGGPFVTLAVGLEDAVLTEVADWEHKPEASLPLVLYVDESAGADRTRYYRLQAANAGGTTPWSAVLAWKKP